MQPLRTVVHQQTLNQPSAHTNAPCSQPPRASTNLVAAINVDLGDQIPVRILHVLERDIPQNAGIVDEDVHGAKGLDSRLNHLLSNLDGVVVGDGLAALLYDLLDDNVCCLCNASVPLHLRIALRMGRERSLPECRCPRP